MFWLNNSMNQLVSLEKKNCLFKCLKITKITLWNKWYILHIRSFSCSHQEPSKKSLKSQRVAKLKIQLKEFYLIITA